jgi:hypothetical protein
MKYQGLIRDVLLQREPCLLGGAEKTLKTWLALTVAVSVASGVPLFGNQRFPVFKRGKVLIITGEGGARLVKVRIERLCESLGVDPASVQHHIHVSDDIAPITSTGFASSLDAAILEHDPMLVILDPLYTYMGSNVESGDLFSMGPVYAQLRDIVGDRSLVICVHFNKPGKDKLELSSITQAGGREFAPSWILVGHRRHPNLEEQEFGLRVLTGGREGYSAEFGLDVRIGPIDVDGVTGELRHDSVPTFQVTQSNAGVTDWLSEIYDRIAAAPFTLTRDDLEGRGTGRNNRRKALNGLIDTGVIRSESRDGPHGGRKADRWGPTGVDLSEAMERTRTPAQPQTQTRDDL